MAETESEAASFEQVLADELQEIERSRSRRSAGSTRAAPDDAAPGHNGTGARRRAHGLQLVGLAFSGGGIRSATFNLGVLQGLASLRLLRHVDYLSTVSGGGYIGSWLTAWVHRWASIDSVEWLLAPRAAGRRCEEPPSIRFLRRYSNYLTPRVGAFSADTWTAISLYLRNSLLNLTIVISFLAAALLLPRIVTHFYLVVAGGLPHGALYIAIGLLLLAIVFVSLNLRTHCQAPTEVDCWYARQEVILISVVVPVFLAAWFGTAGLEWGVDLAPADVPAWQALCPWLLYTALVYGGAWALSGLLAAWLRPATGVSKHLGISFILAGVPAACVGGWMLWGIARLLRYWCSLGAASEWYAVGLGVPLVVSAFSLAAVLHIGLAGRLLPDDLREWWSRLGGWLLIVTLGWLAIFGIAVYGPFVVTWGELWAKAAGALWVMATATGLWAGRRAETGGREGSRVLEIVARVAPYVFVIGILLALSLGIQWLLAYVTGWLEPEALAKALSNATQPRSAWRLLHEYHWTLLWTGTTAWLEAQTCALAAAIVVVLSWRVDINLFSLHSLYRNRLVRCYLGASRQRHASPFTGFDRDDDLPLSRLASASSGAPAHPGPYPIINAALNLVAGEDLAWQQRKAASFILSPLYCGYQVTGPRDAADTLFDHGYQSTSRYAGGDVGLGTAMAISGAAASPNMGYHTAAPLAFLMTVFDVRLGWWSGNPRHRRGYDQAGPRVGLAYLMAELFAFANERRKYVYLSDGGHFENLGIYELVRRRCRFIIACDASQDEGLKFEDLGNALRKCRTDLGVDITIDVDPIRRQAESGRSLWPCAVGTIHYEEVDRGAPPGTLLYLKASLTGREPTDVLNYAASAPAFPHESTADQWFDESQFESYRQLGEHIARATFADAEAAAHVDGRLSVERLFVTLRQRWYPPSHAVSTSFTKHSRKLDSLTQILRADPRLEFLDAQIYPAWPDLTRDAEPSHPVDLWLPRDYEQLRAGFYFCASLLHLMEDVYLDLDLEQEHDHPDNRGWMNLFKHWSWCGMLRATWAVTASTYGARFQTFCESKLGLDLGRVAFRDLGGGSVLPAVVDRAQQDGDLNFVEADRIRAFLADPGRYFASGLPNLTVLRVEVVSPSSAATMRFTFGFALVAHRRLVYLRVQDHLRKMGLARDALRALLREGGVTDELSPDARAVASEKECEDLAALLRSARNEMV